MKAVSPAALAAGTAEWLGPVLLMRYEERDHHDKLLHKHPMVVVTVPGPAAGQDWLELRAAERIRIVIHHTSYLRRSFFRGRFCFSDSPFPVFAGDECTYEPSDLVARLCFATEDAR